MRAHFWILAALFVAGCGGGTVSVLPEPFTRERADGKIPVKAELIRKQVRAELDGTPAGEAEVARWQTIETDYNQCRLSSTRATSKEAEAVFAVCMSKKGYVYMLPVDAEQFHNDIVAEIRKAKEASQKQLEESRRATAKWEEERRITAEKRADEARRVAAKQAAQKLQDADLYGASYHGDVGNVNRMIKNGANPNAAYDDGYTPLMAASQQGHTEVVKALLASRINPNAAADNGETALMLAANVGHGEIVKLLLAKGANPRAVEKDGWTALMWAADKGHTEIAELLLAANANPNAVDKNGITALMEATYEGHPEFVKFLLDNGANPNAVDKHGEPALMEAAWKGHSEIVKLLLSAGASTNVAEKRGWTALHHAAEHEHPGITALLLSCGANPNLKNQHGATAWDWARRNVAVLPVFEEYQRKLNSGWRPQSCKGRWWSPNQTEVGGRVAAGASAKLPSTTNTAETVFEKVWRSVVVIKSGSKQGSGVIVRPNVVATNCHVLDSGPITVYKHDNRRASTDTLFAATVRKHDTKNDFCLLDVSGLGGIPAKIRKYDTLKIGETVYALGSPKGLDLSLSSGLISQLRQGGGERIIQTDAAISPGSSGGGLFDSAGNLIGITTLIHKDADAANIGFAIPADLALD